MIKKSIDETIRKIGTDFSAIIHLDIEKMHQTKTKFVAMCIRKLIEINLEKMETNEKPA